MIIALATAVHDIRDPRVTLKSGRGLSREGHQVHLVGGSNDGSIDENAFRNQFLGTMHWHKLTAGFSYRIRLQRQIEIWQALKKIAPDLLIIPDPELIPLAASWRAIHKTPFIIDIHEDTSDPYYSKNALLYPLVQWALNHADGVTFAFSLERRPNHPTPGVPHTEAYNYYPFEIYSPEPSPEKDFTKNSVCLAYTGVLAPERGTDRFISLVKEINRHGQDCEGIIAGRCYYPDFLSELKKRLADSPVRDKITLYGGSHFISWFRLQEILERADLGYLVYPGGGLQHELPTKVYEYAAHHIPVVCSNIPSFKNYTEKYDCGICLKNNDITSQARQVISYWQYLDHEKIPRIFEPINKKTWEIELQNIVQLIKEVKSG